MSAGGPAIPPELRAAMQDALSALDAAPDGWLGLPARRHLREAYGPWTPPYEPGGPDAGLLRRAALQAAAARRALPRWEEAFPADDRPRRLICLVAEALAGRAPEADVNALAAELRRSLEPMGTDPTLESAFLSGSAAAAHAVDAYDGDVEEEDPPDLQDTDLDRPTVEGFAAYALGFDDPDAYRAFWRWYVTKAFPAAYRAAP
jgi:Immunity protein Imm5